MVDAHLVLFRQGIQERHHIFSGNHVSAPAYFAAGVCRRTREQRHPALHPATFAAHGHGEIIPEVKPHGIMWRWPRGGGLYLSRRSFSEGGCPTGKRAEEITGFISLFVHGVHNTL
jgi:hypothetical protein